MSIKTEAETPEQTYRRAYRDGWVEALNAMQDAFERNLSKDGAHLACWKHSEEALSEWADRARNQAATHEEPPAIQLKRRR